MKSMKNEDELKQLWDRCSNAFIHAMANELP
jgi:hypothetical protein